MRQLIFTISIILAIITHIVLRFAASDAYLIDATDSMKLFATEASELEIKPPAIKSTDDIFVAASENELQKDRKEWKGILTMVED